MHYLTKFTIPMSLGMLLISSCYRGGDKVTFCSYCVCWECLSPSSRKPELLCLYLGRRGPPKKRLGGKPLPQVLSSTQTSWFLSAVLLTFPSRSQDGCFGAWCHVTDMVKGRNVRRRNISHTGVFSHETLNFLGHPLACRLCSPLIGQNHVPWKSWLHKKTERVFSFSSLYTDGEREGC